MCRAALSVLLMAMVVGCAATPTEPRYAEVTSPEKSHCLMTGSRIASREGDCFTPGRSYSTDDIGRTRATTAAGALRQLDPSIMIRQ